MTECLRKFTLRKLQQKIIHCKGKKEEETKEKKLH